MEKFKELNILLETAEAVATAFFEKGNKAAGTHLRNAMQQAQVSAQDIRNEVTVEHKNIVYLMGKRRGSTLMLFRFNVERRCKW